ncbi:MAG: ATP-binding protein [Lewinellaceae bacterium]|nr:ATP-binding protein [Phaeodactylibacter sp.]MCB9035870.1 ATP-binding protein [Lewinellaceae bacterium]
MFQEPVLIGRKKEIETLKRVQDSYKSEFIILYGRRRVGKTFLVNQLFDGQFTFRMTALANATTKQQLLNFHTALMGFGPALADLSPPSSWFEAFQLVIKLAEKDKRTRKVIFFDELPWFDTYGADFLSALEHFWNSWASLRNDILLISCGSAASWMINKLIRNKGGLHNRITERILLQPFTLSETEAFLQAKGAEYDRYQLLELYMAMGGVPFYLENVQVNRSVAQNIDRMFFSPTGLLRLEYDSLYQSLFNQSARHIAVVEALAQRPRGLARKELISKAGLSEGGSASAVLNELEHSGFIKPYIPFGKKRRYAIHRLTDAYSLFYLTFVKDSRTQGEGAWLARLNNPQWRAWSGYAFEDICMHHIDPIKKHLGISGVYTEVSPWRSQQAEPAAQIDLLIDRNDRVINICEMKFSVAPYSITKTYAEQLANKIMAFRTETNTRKTLFLTMITAFGLQPNQYSLRLVKDALDMNALFD